MGKVFLLRTSSPAPTALLEAARGHVEDRTGVSSASALGLVGTGISSAAVRWGQAFPVLLLGQWGGRSWLSGEVAILVCWWNDGDECFKRGHLHWASVPSAAGHRGHRWSL